MSLISQMVVLLLTLLSKEQGKKLLDGLLDKVEDLVADSENKIDDALVLPLCDKIREIMDIPDED